MYDDMPDDNYIQDHDQELADRDTENAERDEQDEAADPEYSLEAEARASYTDSLARVVSDTLVMAAKLPDGKEEVVLKNIRVFLDSLETQGFCYAGEVITRASYIALN